MNYLRNSKFDWENIKVIGFDLDGTLYDEFDFINQVYTEIAKMLELNSHKKTEIKSRLLSRWLEKGSSYPYLFKEVIQEFELNEDEKLELELKSLELFRNFEPVLVLSERTKFLLSSLKERFQLFLVTDGSSNLQWNKIKSLDIDKYFDLNNISVSGDYGSQFYKPSPISIQNISLFRDNKDFNNSQVLYIGDRTVDFDFANNSGFNFMYINSLFLTF